MHRRNPGAPSPLGHLHRVGPTLEAAAFLLIAGIALGLIAAALLRRRGRAWTWALLGLAPVAPVALAVRLGADPEALVPPLCPLLGGVVTAVGWGLHADLEDRRSGGDREIAARARHRPSDLLRRHLAERISRRPGLLADGVPIGRSGTGELACLPRGDARSGRHVLVPGATGAGKTTTLGALLVESVIRGGQGAVVLEAKNDAALLTSAREAAGARGARFHLLSPEGPAVYDPLAHGSVDERSERLLAVEDWGSADADFYRQAASPFLRLVIRLLDQGPDPATLAAVAASCSGDELMNLAASLGDPALLEEARAQVTALDSDQKRAVAGLRARLSNLASSEFARSWLDPTAPGHRLDLREAIAAREVAYFRFDTDRTGNVGRAIAQMVLLDLGATASATMDRGVGTFVCIDEFGALEASALERLFVRGRAAGFSVALGTQTLADLLAAGEAVRARIGATVSGLVCHRIGEQEDAEWLAGLIGTVPTWQTTIRTEGYGRHTREGTRTRGHRFEVNPSELQRLGRGEAYVARLDRPGARRAHRVMVVPPWSRLPGRSGR